MNSKTTIENEDRVTVEVSTELGHSGAKVLKVKIGGFIVKHRISENFGEHILIFREGMKKLTDPSVDDTTIGMFEKTTKEFLFPNVKNVS